MSLRSTTLGGLSCVLVDQLPQGQVPQLIVIICHGFGAPGTDLVPLGHEVLRLSPKLAETIRLVFPAAPLSLDEFGMVGGRAWWHLDINRLTQAIESGELRDLRENLPDDLPQARQMLLSLIEDVQRETELPMSRLVLGGFSQGSMLATDVALRLPEAPAALCIWSGTLLCESIWKELAAKRDKLMVLQSHGHQDPVLPFEGGIWLRDLLRNAGASVEFIEFDGVHTIPAEAVHRFATLLERLLIRETSN